MFLVRKGLFFLTFMVQCTILFKGRTKLKIIKRYKNRRFYDTETSRVVTHSDISKMIKSGIEIKIIDTATGKDISLAVLGRVFLTETSSWDNIKQTKELLSEIISKGGDKSMSLLKNTILASIGALHVTKEKAEKIIDDLIKRGDLDKSSRKKAVMELLSKAEKSTEKFRKKFSSEASKAQKEITNAVKDLKLVKHSDFKKLESKVNKIATMLGKIDKKISSL